MQVEFSDCLVIVIQHYSRAKRCLSSAGLKQSIFMCKLHVPSSEEHCAQRCIVLRGTLCSEAHCAQRHIVLRGTLCSEAHCAQRCIVLRGTLCSEVHCAQR